MGMLYDDAVVISTSDREGDYSTVITVNCPDKTGLGCDLCRIILLFGLSIDRGGDLLLILVLNGFLRLAFPFLSFVALRVMGLV